MAVTIVARTTKAEYREMALLGQTDLFYMCRYILNLNRYVEGVHDIMTVELQCLMPDESLMGLWPRGTFKSTTGCYGWPLYLISRTAYLFDGTPPNPEYDEYDPTYGDIRINLITYKKEKSMAYLMAIRGQMEEDTLYAYLYRGPNDQRLYNPDRPALRWRGNMIDVSTRLIPRREPTVLASGILNIDTGYHHDRQIFDDPVDPIHVDKVEERERVARGFKAAVPLLDPGGRQAMLGTRWHIDDLYAWVKKNARDIKFRVEERPAIDQKTGKPNFPTIFSIEFLARQKALLEDYYYNCNYLLNPKAESTHPFHRVLWIDIARLFKDEYEIATVCDFNDSKTRRSHYSALINVAYGIKRNIVVILDFWMGQAPGEENAPEAIDLAVRARDNWVSAIPSFKGRTLYRGMYLESDAGQKLMRFPLRMAMVKKREIIPIRMIPARSGHSKEWRIRQMVPRAKASGILFNKDLKNHPMIEQALAQLTGWPGEKYDDFPDAMSNIQDVWCYVTTADEVNTQSLDAEMQIDFEKARETSEKELAAKGIARAFNPEGDLDADDSPYAGLVPCNDWDSDIFED